MPRKRAKEPKAAENETESTPTTPPPVKDPLKEQFQKLQLALYARALKPVDWKIPIPKTKDDVVALQVELMNRNFERTITPDDFSGCNQAVKTLAGIICPKPVPNVTVHVEQTLDMRKLKRKVDAMNENGMCYRYLYSLLQRLRLYRCIQN